MFILYSFVALVQLAPAVLTQDVNNSSSLIETTPSTENATTEHFSLTSSTNATSLTTVHEQILTLESCSKYEIQSTTHPTVKLKQEPKCTESGAVLDQLNKFIGLYFDQHECGNAASTTEYSEMLYCLMLTTHSQCLQNSQKDLNLDDLPQLTAVRRALAELCAVNHTLARACMLQRLKYVTRCVKTDVESILALQEETWTYHTLDTCRHLELKMMCMYEELQACGDRTAAFMTQLIGVRLRPKVCPLAGGHGGFHSHVSLTVILAVITFLLSQFLNSS